MRPVQLCCIPYYGNYTASVPAAPRAHGVRPGKMKSARAGNAIDVRRRRCAECVDALPRRWDVDVGAGSRLRPSVRPDRSWRALRSWKLRSTTADVGQRRPGGRSEHMHKTGTEPGYMAGTSAGAVRGVQSRLYPVLQGVKDRLIPAACSRHPSSFGRSFPNANGT